MHAIRFTLLLLTALACLPAQGFANPQAESDNPSTLRAVLHGDTNARAAPEFQIHTASIATPDARGDTSDFKNIHAPMPVATNAGATDPCGRARAGSGGQNDPFARCAGTRGGSEGLNGGLDLATWSDDTFALDARDARPRAAMLLQVVAVSDAAMALLFGLGIAGLVRMRRLSATA